MDSEKKQLMTWTCRQFMEIGLGGGDPGLLDQLLDENVVGLGTAIDEKIRGIEEVVKLIEIQKEQSIGFDLSWRIVPISHYTTADENTAVFADDVYLTIKTGEKTIDMYVRFSVVLNYVDGLWKVIHWHGSKPEQVESEKDTWGVDIWKQKAEELEHLVEEKTADLLHKNIELQIEAALEKVRSVAMGMKKPEDMLLICTVISQQLAILGLKDIRNVQTAIFYPDRGTYMNYEYYARHDKTFATEVDYQNHQIQLSFARKMMQGPNEEVREHLKGEKLLDWFNYQKTTNQFADEYLLTADSLNYYWFSLGPVALGISTYAPLSPESIDLFKRFMKVFELAYQRYLDIEKAQLQAREAQIEAALERVRARSMAMRSSEELKDVISLLLDQIRKLDIPADHAGFYIDYKQRDDWHIWLADPNQIPYELTVPYFDCLVWHNYNNAKEQGLDAFAYTYSFEEKNDFYEKMFRLFPIPDEARTFYLNCPGLSVSTVLLETVGLYVENFSGTPYTGDENSTVKRFGKVFQQTYTRFLDLQRAEEQTREAEIQLALERVRARAMAMHSSQELKEVAHVLRKQMGMLGQKELETCVIHLHDESTEYIQSWVSIDPPDSDGETLETTANVPKNGLLIIEEALSAYAANRKEYVIVNEGEKLKQWFSFLEQASPDGYKKISDSAHGDIAKLTSYWSFADFDGGSLLMVTRDEPDEATRGLLRRFSQVFGMAYRRFADLKHAEAQAREAQIEAALERVRSRSISMRKSGEIAEIAAKIFSEMRQLDLQLNRVLIWTFNDTEKYTTWWSSNPEVESTSDSYRIDYNNTTAFLNYLEAWQQRKPIHLYTLAGEIKRSFEDYLFAHTEMAKLPTAVKNGMLAETNLYTVSIISDYGIMMSGSLEPLSDLSIDIIQRFGRVFQQSYTRYLDVQKAEAQARESQIQLALERVRARSMAMQHSNELAEVSYLLNKQVVELGIPTRGCAFNIYNEHDSTEWFSNLEGTLPAYKTPRENVFLKYYEAGQQGETLMIEAFGKERIRQHYEYLFSLGYFGSPEHKDEILGKVMPESQFDHVAFFKYGYLLFITLEPAPEAHDIFKRFAKEFEQTYTRFLDLQKAEAQAREAQIEAALERVRSKAMAMHNSSDLPSTAIIAFTELKKLGFIPMRTGISIQNKENRKNLLYSATTTNEGDTLSLVGWAVLDNHPVLAEVYNSWLRGEDCFPELKGELLKSYYDQVRHSFQVPEEQTLHEQYGYFISFTHGVFYGWCKQPVNEDEKKLLKRFAAVIDLTFKRYFDLQKAEAQAREAQVEAALERVRYRAMAMQSSNDVSEATATTFTELKALGIEIFRCGIAICKENEELEVWSIGDSGTGNTVKGIGHLSIHLHPLWKFFYNTWKQRESFGYSFLTGKEKEDYVKIITNTPGYKLTQENLEFPDLHFQSYQFEDGGLFTFSVHQQNEEEKRILTRFTNVFALTYRRFKDLQTAEAQAREATIQASLERVRAKAMAMHSSKDLADTIHTFYAELVSMNLTPRRVGMGLIDKETHIAEISAMNTTEDGISVETIGKLEMRNHPVLEGVYENWLLQKEYWPVLRGNEIKEYYQLLRKQAQFPDFPNDAVQYGHFFFFEDGGVYAWTEKQLEESELEVYRRFTSVLSLTYRRYKDLKDAEAREKEAVKQAALDRIRADIASMRTVEDLQRITPLIWNELTILHVPFIRCGIFIMDDDVSQIHTFLSSPDGKAIASFHLPYETSDNIADVVAHWKANSMYVNHWEIVAFTSLADSLVQQGAIGSREQYMVSLPPEGIYLHFLPFMQGMLYVGNSDQLSDDNLDLLQSVADAFSTAYARYEDFNRLEAAKRQVDSTLNELQATQKQLIQSEKMASLGELTAGIAHEIQNPLNFVNNFSEINAELSEEILDAAAKGDLDEVKVLAKDIKSNQEKIRDHGKRADSIVKGMLQHSRSSTGVKEPTDITALADEYLRLAYHGMRAKDKAFNASLKTDFEDGIPLVPVVAQDIGRVLLNLFNNAFYAVNERKKTGGDGYQPEVRVDIRTDRNGDASCIYITVSDNGNGIPDSIRGKIFQPFFTTKPTGQGTGLGLSLTYDIIKAHGGEIKIETEEGQGSAFTIQLPVT